jgi:hypothetical protein
MKQEDNYGRKAVAYLPTIKVDGMKDPVVQVIDATSDEVVYTIRIKGTSFRPKVFKAGKYTVKVGEQSIGMVTIESLQSLTLGESRTVYVHFDY